MAMKIINVTEVINASVENLTSFVIANDSEETKKVEEAEQYFRELAKQNGAGDSEMEDFVENGYYCQDGYSVFLTWSNVK